MLASILTICSINISVVKWQKPDIKAIGPFGWQSKFERWATETPTIAESESAKVGGKGEGGVSW